MLDRGEASSSLAETSPKLDTEYGVLFGVLTRVGESVRARAKQLIAGPSLKRAMDIAGSLVLMLLSSPIFLLSIAINLSSKQSVFYRQLRVGKQGIPFEIIKFRTMYPDADVRLKKLLAKNACARREWEQAHKLKDDPRVTRLGSILRKTSLDELPQLWNVLKNDMSLVGPRPIVADEIVRYAGRYESYLRVKPGLTGLWQVSGRNDVSYRRRVLLDEYYSKNHNILMDVWILLKTPFHLLRLSGY